MPKPKPTLVERRSPWVVFTRADDPWWASESAALTARDGLVLRLDGRELRDAPSVFRTFAQELEFVGCFGHNWDALVDCLHDWHGPGHGDQDLAIVVEHADALRDARFLGLLVSVCATAAWRSNLRLDADGDLDEEHRRRIAQHFVFLLDHTSSAAFTEAVARGADVAVALAEGRLLATLTDADWPGGDPAAAPWTAGPLAFADEEILAGRPARAVEEFRSRLDCSAEQAADVLRSRSAYLRGQGLPCG
ncbi:barstar family protein [Kitasatospora terrestris]|uniref:Barstar (barnase inhibitor) domain-containing protein n=1 Tax=Kitasatospora terrestris TaxID=258051 RepID=A0ABP9D837_9ACTN